jgi:hypothetical protein
LKYILRFKVYKVAPLILQANLTIEMASTALDKDRQRLDEMIAGPHSFKLNRLVFLIEPHALDALKELDQRFGKKTEEKKKHGHDLEVWRILKIKSMKLRFFFYTCASYSKRNDVEVVEVFGFKTKDVDSDICFKGPSAYDCYVRFLDGVALSQQHASTVAMGQHTRLGSQSLLSILPEALFRVLLQPHITTLEHWDCDKEDALRVVIKQQEFEETKGWIDEIVTSYDTTHHLYFLDIRNVREACVVLDQRFGEDTREEVEYHKFNAERRLTTNGRTIKFTFTYDKFYEESHIIVNGLGKAAGLAHGDLDYKAFVYLIDTLLVQARHYEFHIDPDPDTFSFCHSDSDSY